MLVLLAAVALQFGVLFQGTASGRRNPSTSSSANAGLRRTQAHRAERFKSLLDRERTKSWGA